MKDLTNKKLLKEWKKIETANIFSTLEEFADFYYANGEKSCFRIITSEPWSKDNFFFGDYSALLDYYKYEFPKRRVGQKFHSLTIIDVFYKDVNGKESLYAKCKCDCGNETEKLLDSIIKGNARTCGCREGQGYRKIEREKLSKDVIDEYWDYERNTVNPETIEQRSKEKFWFKDKEGHSYKLAPYTYAKNETATSFPEQSVYYYVKKFFPDTVNKAQYVTKDGEVLEIDIFIPSLNIAIEYDGLYWHEKRFNGDSEKNKVLSEDGLYVIRIRESGLPTLDVFNGITIIREKPFNKDESLIVAINKTLLKLKNISQKNITKIKEERFDKDKLSILSLIYYVPKEENLSNYNFNSVWDYKNNGTLTPECIDFTFPHNLRFKCKYGFEISNSPKNIVEKVKRETKTCPLSCFCLVDYKEPCEFYVQDYLYQKIKSGRRDFRTRACCTISEETFLTFILDSKSIIYSDFSKEWIFKFGLIFSFEYSYFAVKTILNYLLHNNITDLYNFFTSLFEELDIHEICILLKNEKIFSVMLDYLNVDNCCRKIGETLNFLGINGTDKIIYVAQFLAIISKKFSKNELEIICKYIKEKSLPWIYEYFIAEIKEDTFLRNIEKNEMLANIVKENSLDIYNSTKTYFCQKLEKNRSITDILNTFDRFGKANFIFYLFKKNLLPNYINHSIDLTYVATENEIVKIDKILNNNISQKTLPLTVDIDVKFSKEENCENSAVSKLNTFNRSVENATDKLNSSTNDFTDLCKPKKEKKKTDKKKSKEKVKKVFGIIWLILKWIFYIFWEVFNFLFLVLLFFIGFLDGLFFHKIRMQGVYKRAAQKAAATRKRNAPYKNSKRPRAYNLK